ncbi:MAG: YitT family protein [Chloroflexota bacterium]
MRQKLKTAFSKFQLKATFQEFLVLTAGAVLLAVGIDVFMAPANIAPGGVAGIAIIINHFTGWPIGVSMLVLNIPMLFLGYQHLGRFRFLTRTLYVVLVYNLGVDLLAPWLPAGGLTNDLLLNSLYTAVVGGIGSGLVYRAQGTSAGTGVLGRVLQLKTGIPLSQIYMMTDGGIIGLLGLVFGWERALYSLLTLFIWGVVTDYIMEGPSVIRTAFIVTDQAEVIARALLSRLGIGVTAWVGRGMFTEAEHTVLFCTLSRPDVNIFKAVVNEIDPRAFVVIGQGHHARGGVVRHLKELKKPDETKP